jgi:hypothetical protein
METRTIKISLETAQRWYNGTDNELKELAVQTYPEVAKKELPKSWEELEKINGYWICSNSKVRTQSFFETRHKEHKLVFATKEQAEASIAMAQLSQLMKVYNDGWEPDWTISNNKYVIEIYMNRIERHYYQGKKYFLSFKDAEIRDLFLENFRELIETAKPLL